MRLLLTQREINIIKQNIAQLDNTEPCLISDEEVFGYISAAEDFENQRSIWMTRDGEQHFQAPLNKVELAQRMMDRIVGWE